MTTYIYIFVVDAIFKKCSTFEFIWVKSCQESRYFIYKDETLIYDILENPHV